MDENKNSTMPPEEEGLDIMALVRSLWEGRKTIIICTVIFMALGLVAAITMKRIYTVETVMVPQIGDNSKNGLGSLAALAGIDLGMASNGELSPLAYPQIVGSVPFRLTMMHTPLHYEKCDTLISMLDYYLSGYEKPTVMDYVIRYTIGLPFMLLNAIRGPEEEVVYYQGEASEADPTPRPLAMSMDEFKMQKDFGKVVSLDVDKKEGFLTLRVTGSEPLQTAELAMKAQQLLQDKVTQFHVEKSQKELEYIQARYDEIKQENDRNQGSLAAITDRTQNVATYFAQVERNRAQSKFNISNAVYLEMAKQLEQAKMKVKKDTPVFTVIQPVTIPMKPANSRAKKLIIWTFFGIFVGCGIVLFKYYLPTIKEKLNMGKKESESDSTPEATSDAPAAVEA